MSNNRSDFGIFFFFLAPWYRTLLSCAIRRFGAIKVFAAIIRLVVGRSGTAADP
jgi:hypothetical protein